ncbi:hypothetical protein PHYPSEUDO_015065 [Phytophthora pseudosyringae]|uniref:Transmembrane protein n=1 Tax=Phytophthora pseudosyringae TaxID=221518 RepID=A0A8T1WFU2_9STRA|nr:hypothetical protein PHYPSEUDO_015065 [Phytophthora pseudosyringae]
MRMRLRAPDEPEAESSYDFGDGSAPSTPERSHLLPPLDVGSPEYIEERLENLKRRPNWGDFLDQYVHDHADSESESEAGDFADVSAVEAPGFGFIRSTLWSLLVVAFAPLLILCAPCLRHKDYGFWPLGCRSMKELFGCAMANVIFFVVGLVLLYWTICREMPDVFKVNNTLVKLNVQIDEVQRAADTCHAALLQWERTLAQELCMPVGIDAALLLLNAWLLLHYHRRWARYLMLLMAVTFVVDVPTKLYDATFPAPEIHKVDPTYAMVDEELLVALDGKNLKPGGSIAWVAYWGCTTTENVDVCDKQFASTFEAGNVAVTFKSLDHFIPCYRDPPNPLKAQDYQCFEDIRIRVKDKQSIPGWSRLKPQTASISQAAKTEPSLSDEWQGNLEVPFFKNEEGTDHDAIKPTHRLARSAESLEAVEIDISVATGSSSESLTTESGGESGLKKEAAELSEEEVANDNESFPRSSAEDEPDPTKVEAGIADERLNEVEMTPDAGVNVLHINTELKNVLQSEDAVLPEDSSQEPVTDTEELQISSDTLVEVEDKTEIQAEAIPADEVKEREPMNDAYVEEGVRIVDDEIELSTMVVVLDEETVQMVPDSQDYRKLEAQVKIDTESNTYEALSEEVSISVTDVSKRSDPKQEISTPVDTTAQAKETQSKPHDTPSKKRKTSKRKGQRSRQTKKASEPAIVNSAEVTAAAV